MEVSSLNKGYYILLRENNTFEYIQSDDLKTDKLNLLIKHVKIEENKMYSKLHSIYNKYFPEWNVNSRKLIIDIYKRLLKVYPSEFANFKTLDSCHLFEKKLEVLKRHVINFDKIHIDYNCMKIISTYLLNCVHFIHKLNNKKLTINGFLKKENMNLLHKFFQSFFNELETIKSINIQLFDKLYIPTVSSTYKSDNYLLNRRETILTNNTEMFLRSCNSENLYVLNNFNTDTKDNEKCEIIPDFVYVFFLFLDFIFPNHLEIELNLNMSNLLEKCKDKNGDYKSLQSLNKKFESHFLTILLITYFISKDNRIQKLNLKTFDSLKIEIDNYLHYVSNSKICDQGKKQIFEDLIFLDNFYRTLNFYSLNIEFNSLDPILFQRINNIYFKNIGIRSLHIKLFPDSMYYTEKRNLYNLKQILRIQNCEKGEKYIESQRDEQSPTDLNLKSKIPTNFCCSQIKNSNLRETKGSELLFSSTNLDEELYGSECKEILRELFPSFNLNITDLFLIIESKINILRDLKVLINPTSALVDHYEYTSLLTIFIYNVLKIIENNNNEIISLEIESTKISLDYFLLGIAKNKERHIDLRKTNIINLILNIKLDNHLNIMKLIPHNIVCLNLAALTNETFIFLVNKLKRKFCTFKNLIELTINVNLTNHDINKLVDFTNNFFMLDKPKSLENLKFNLKFILRPNHIKKLIEIIQNKDNIYKFRDRIRNYVLDFGLNSNNNFDEFPRRIFLYRFDDKYETKLEKLLFAIKKSNLIEKFYQKEKIIKSISNFCYTYSKVVYLE